MAKFKKNKTNYDFSEWSVKCDSQEQADVIVSSLIEYLNARYGIEVESSDYEKWITIYLKPLALAMGI